MPEASRTPRELMSWKEIADYLHISVRTAQTWEREKGLPVQHMAGKKGRVSANPAELDRWKQSASRSNHWLSNPACLKAYVVLATALLIATAAYESIHYWDQSRQARSSSVRVKEATSANTAHNGNGRSKMTLPEAAIQTGSSDTVSALHRKISFADIDNDGELETILDYSPVPSLPTPSQLERSANCGEVSEELGPAPASSADRHELPLTSSFERSTLFRSVRTFTGRGLLSGCQLPSRYKGLLAATP